MREFRTYGSVRGVRSNAHPYRVRALEAAVIRLLSAGRLEERFYQVEEGIEPIVMHPVAGIFD